MVLFEAVERERRADEWKTWRPEAPPILDGVTDVIIDFETNGLKWWDKHRPGGLAYYTPDGRTGYLPWAHQGDPVNLDENVVKRWAREQLKGKRLLGCGTPFDVHMSHEWGVDLEEIGCQVSDVQHWAALLDDSRRVFRQEVLCQDFLPPHERKVLAVNGETLDGSKMMEYPAGMIAVRAMADVRQVALLKEVMWPMLTAEELHDVRQIEDDCIFASCEMERNGLPLDLNLLKKWKVESEQRYLRYLWEIQKGTGLNFNPKSSESWARLLRQRNVEPPELTATGQVSVQHELLRYIPDEYVQLGCKAMKLADLKSDYIDKYWETAKEDGILRFRLNQLRSDEGGTITGRFSASAYKINKETIGCNPQQVLDNRKAVDKGHDPEYQIRKLFLTDVAADAKQIEYRIFAHYAKNPKVLEAYRQDPDLSFHKLIHGMILPHKPDLSYEHQKNINFMKIYAGGLVKLAVMMGHITPRQAEDLRAEYAPKAPPRNHPLLQKAAAVDDIYARELPEVGPLVRKASDVAKNRGYVKTIKGRRCRFPTGQRLHKALNGIIQGGAADVMKIKMIEVHRERKRIGFVPRCTVHDELVGNKLSDETPKLLLEVLNRQSLPELTVPILWDVKTGANWGEC